MSERVSETSRVLLGKDLERYAALLFIDPAAETHLMYLVPKFMQAPLPEGWNVSADECGRKLYRNVATGRASLYHPLSYYFVAVAELERLSGKEPGPSLRMDQDGHVVIDRVVADYLLKDQATLQDVRAAMEYLGISDDDSEDLLRLAMQYYLAPLPPGWRRVQMPDSSYQFFNIDTGEKSEKGPLYDFFLEKANIIRQSSSEKQQPVSEREIDTTAENKITHKENTAYPVPEVLVMEDTIMVALSVDKAGNYIPTEGILREASAHEVNGNLLIDSSYVKLFNDQSCLSPNDTATVGKSPENIEATKGIRLLSRRSPAPVCESLPSPSDKLCDQYPSKDSVEPTIQSLHYEDTSAQDAISVRLSSSGSEHAFLKSETNMSSLSPDIYKKPVNMIPSNLPTNAVRASNRTTEDTLIPCSASDYSLKDLADESESATNVDSDRKHPDVVSDTLDRENHEVATAETAAVGDRHRQDCAWYISGYKKANSLLASRACYLLMDAVLKATQNT